MAQTSPNLSAGTTTRASTGRLGRADPSALHVSTENVALLLIMLLLIVLG